MRESSENPNTSKTFTEQMDERERDKERVGDEDLLLKLWFRFYALKCIQVGLCV